MRLLSGYEMDHITDYAVVACDLPAQSFIDFFNLFS